MPAAQRQITRADILPDADFAKVRKERRASLLPVKRLRRVELGPVCTFYFETFETMLFQVQEMLLVEKGGEAQIADELSAYNPLIPQGDELVATVMFEIEDERRRAALLARLGGAEDSFFIQIGADKVMGVPEGDIERTREDGKTSSVHFLHFSLTEAQKAKFRDPTTAILVGCDHEHYAHMAALSPAARAELSKDFA
ncbi:DUF3501 family protein [Phenylobacterium montanum]|uniref:DUF3501 family protein n=1 Tax=Phenylobacterium montanum TaxID=2823693 RepID=A0A975G1F1_9CAUL|nr:DUF3501 family protein [Caulobacter sp. S6]QUD88211.1 DUF3501 family protein [Caulobacter sp. S6]